MGFKDRINQQLDAARDSAPAQPVAPIDFRPGTPDPSPLARTHEYDVVEIREKLLSGRGSAPSQALRALLNERAAQGWRLKNLVSGEVAGMVGKREGWMVIFEREMR